MNRRNAFILSLILWMLLTWNWSPFNLAAGVVVAVLTALMTGMEFGGKAHKFIQLRRYAYFLAFIPVFLLQLVKANILMAYRVLSPRLPIKPSIVKAKTKLESHTGRAFLANAITLTPGTLTVEIKDDTLYIHWIYTYATREEEVARQVIQRFEPFLKEIFE